MMSEPLPRHADTAGHPAAYDPSALLERLLTDAAFRADALAGRIALPAEFRSVDPVQLERTALRLRHDLGEREFRGSGGLRARYPETLAAAREPLDVLLSRFLASTAYAAYREWPRDGQGQCLEEAFYRFAEAIGLGDPALREREFLSAVVRAVLLSPDPGFALPPELVRAPRAVFAITRRGPAVLFAATPEGLVQGALTPFLADLLLEGPGPATKRHGVAAATLEAALTRFRALGLL